MLDLDLRVSVTASNVEALSALVAAGAGYSIIPAVEGGGPDDERIRLFPLGHPDTFFPVYALWRPTSANNPLIAAMLAMLGGDGA